MLFSKTRYPVFLVSILLLVIINPLLEELGYTKAQTVLSIFVTMILLSGVFVIAKTKRMAFLAIGPAMILVALIWLEPILQGWNIRLAFELLIASYFLLIAYSILLAVLKGEKVTWEKISAALCFYLLMGIVWAFFYSILSHLHPPSFGLQEGGFSQFLYYSMITLTTVGYGDILPLTPFARALSFVEAVTGQLYLAVLVARLVGLHIVHASYSRKE